MIYVTLKQEHLYRIADDLHDLAQENPSQVATMRAKLKEEGDRPKADSLIMWSPADEDKRRFNLRGNTL